MHISQPNGAAAASAPPKPNRTRRRPPQGLGQGDKDGSASGQGSILNQIATAIRASRLASGWSVAQTAAWCGVGTRFLVDLEMGKSNVQIERALTVARKMGVDVAVTARAAAGQPAPPGEHWLAVKAPQACTHPQAWLTLCHAAHYMAGASGLKAQPCRVVKTAGLLTAIELNVSDWAGCEEDSRFAMGTGLSDFYTQHSAGAPPRGPWSVPTPRAAWEEHGGPGLPHAFNFINAHSASPWLDNEQLIRWVIFSAITLDGEHHLGRLRFLKGQDGRFARLGSFGELLCASSLFESAPHKGLKIGSAWPELYLRADHWKNLADLAGIHPKVIFQMMRELSARAPGLLEQALTQSLGELPRTGALIQVIKGVRSAAERMGDLAMAASRHIAGLKTKSQPRIDAIPTTLVLAPSKRFISVVDE